MARERMVTRTVESAKVTVMAVNLETHEVTTPVITISNTIEPKKRLKYIQENYSVTGIAIAAIINTEVVETLYGMTEREFIEKAKVLPPRTILNDVE